MKRFALVALLAAMFFSMVSSASAGELKARANFDVYAMFANNLTDLNSDQSDADNNQMAQRARMYFDYISNENLKLVVGFEIDQDWGDNTTTNLGRYSSDETQQIELKHAFLDFNVPDTDINVKAGLQPVALPGVFGSPIFGEDAHALTVSAPINEMFAVSAGYMRLGSQREASSVSANGADVSGDEFDGAFLATPITLDGLALVPYFAYASLGSEYVQNLTNDASATDIDHYWLGANAALTMFDPFVLEADLIYGTTNADEEDYESAGWFAALAGSYKFDMVTPKLFVTYATGNDDDDTDGSEAMFTVREDFSFTPNTGARAFIANDDSWAFAAIGSNALGQEYGNNGVGMWSVGIQLLDISFVENLTHELTIAYMQGTSDYESSFNGVDTPRNYFTEEDSAWEVYFASKYMIFENLAAIVEIDYFQPNLEDRNSGIAGADSTADDASAYIATGFQYKF